MPWKQNEDGSLVVVDGNPVWVYESGPEKDKEAPVNFGKTLTTIQNITRESVNRKEKINELKAVTSVIEAAGIEDVSEYLTKAKEAMDTVANLSDKEILDAGQVDKIKQSITDGFTRQIDALKAAGEKSNTEWRGKLDAKDAAIKDLVIKGAFDASDFLRDKTVLLPEIAFSYFGGRFGVEEKDGRLIGFATDTGGDKIMSLKNPGAYADPVEAIEILINEHPQKDRMLKMDASGGGSKPPKPGDVSGNLQTQYKEAKSKGDVGAMVALKSQMAEQGVPIPL